MTSTARVDWVDYAKGIAIILVVMMHSTLSTGEALHQTGWLHPVVEFAKPFRIPAFFLIAGLFVARTIDADWRSFLDRKILHFVYFYLLWLTIQFVFRAPGYAAEYGAIGAVRMYLTAFIEPFGTLWFIYLLPVFYLATRLTRALPAMLVLLAAAALEIAHVDTGWTLIDEFAARFVYFYAGYLFGGVILDMAERVRPHLAAIAVALAAWFCVTLLAVQFKMAALPVVSLALGAIGAAAVIGISLLLTRASVFDAIRYCGQNSIVIYLAFFLPMAVTRVVLVKTQIVTDPGTVSALVTLVAVTTPLLLHVIVRGTALRFLFERPERFHLVKRKPLRLQPAE